MKTIVEFGIRGSYFTSFTCSSIKKGNELANKIAFSLGADKRSPFECRKDFPRAFWQGPNHFCAVTLLDDVQRGDAAYTLWKRDYAN